MRLVTLVVAASLLLVTAVYGALRLTHTLPSERQAQATLATARRVIDGRAFLYDYSAERIVCIGSDAEDPHGKLVAY